MLRVDNADGAVVDEIVVENIIVKKIIVGYGFNEAIYETRK